MKLRAGLILFLGSLLLAGSAAAAGGKLLGLKTSVDPQGTTILLQLASPVEFTPSRVGPRLYLVDVAGVSSDRPADNQPIKSPLVSSYRIFSYQGADNRSHMGLELTLKEEAEVRPSIVPAGLQIRVQKPGAPAAASSPASPSAPVHTPFAVPSSSPVSPRRASLREVSVIQPEGSTGLEVEILADSELSYKTLKLRNPDRLVVDLKNTVNRIKQRRLSVNTPPLKAVRIAQFRNAPPVARVVMDLDFPVPYEIRNQTNGLVISLHNPDQAAGDPPNTEAPVTAAATTLESGPDTPSTASKESSKTEGESARTAAAPDSEVGVGREPAPKLAEPVLLASNEPADSVAPASMTTSSLWQEGTESSEALSAAAKLSAAQSLVAEPAEGSLAAVPTQSVSSPPKPEPAAEAPVAAEATMPAASVTGVSSTKPVLLAQQTPAAGAAPDVLQQRQQTFTGEPISLNLKDVDLKDFFRLMHEVSGLNVVLDPNVSGTVTIVLDEVPWDQAMDLVMKNNGLEARTIGNVVRIAKVSTLEAEAKAQLAKAQAEQQQAELATPTETVTRNLSYATAADLVTPLKRFLSARGDIVPDPRTNTLVVTDVPSNIAKIDALLSSLDRKTPQVEIEARIVAANRTFARDIGSQLAASGATGNVILGGAGAVGTSPIVHGTVPPLFVGTFPSDPTQFANVSQPLSTDFGVVGATSGLSLVLSHGNTYALDAIITAAESKGIGKLLSRPKIITQNNIEGTVEQGVRIPIQTEVNNTITVQYIDVTLRLTVTPQITADGTIFLKTDIENTTIDPAIERIDGKPALDTQSAETQVLVSDGGTVFFGGIIQTQNTLSLSQVPLLGSIPLVGNLFKRTSTSTNTNELLFFITPKITQS